VGEDKTRPKKVTKTSKPEKGEDHLHTQNAMSWLLGCAMQMACGIESTWMRIYRIEVVKKLRLRVFVKKDKS